MSFHNKFYRQVMKIGSVKEGMETVRYSRMTTSIAYIDIEDNVARMS